MELSYSNKKSEREIFESIPDCHLTKLNTASCVNKLIHGDNLIVLKKLITTYGLAGKVHLIYNDPPFSTNNTFIISEDRAATISNSKGNIAYRDNLKGKDFLEFLRERLILLKMLLASNGSIYLHTDYKIGHYVKIIMDEVFGIENFRNDITRIKCNPKNFERKGYSNIKDMILFYSVSDDIIWNEPIVPFKQEDQEKLFPKIDKNGRHYTTIPLHAPGETQNGKTSFPWKGLSPPRGRHWRSEPEVLEKLDQEGLIEWSSTGNPRRKIYFDEREGKRLQDIWNFKDPQYPTYPTEKNYDLLSMIIKTSSNEGNIVLDCFSGSGTTLKAAQENNRNWIGIDQSEEAIKSTIKKLNNIPKDLFVQDIQYELLRIDLL